MSGVLPMFPLGTVLFPHMYLPLRVFEPRYRALMHDCLEGDREFGVVLIERGSEVGGGDQRTMLGTVAKVADAVEAPDGQWAVATFGTRRIRVTRWWQDDPYPRADIEAVDEPRWADPATVALAAATTEVRRSLALRAELGIAGPPMTIAFDQAPEVAAWQLASVSPLGPLDRQRLLEVDDPAERMDLLARLTSEECTVLTHRLAGG